MDTIKIGKFISEARKGKNLTQADLGNLLNVSDKAVSKWECGKCLPDSSLFEDMCNILDISMVELLKGEHIERDKVDDESNKVINLLLHNMERLKKNQSLSGAICALLISFITAIYSLIWTSNGRAFDEFFSGMIKGISSASLLVGIFLIFYTWVKYSENKK
ncbi:MAG: helix-turn-helix transcriptional regulator [Clostridium sartagoforme]|nr:helix-turn-helix transcriptional regulator [Clostridium sartagoforme]